MPDTAETLVKGAHDVLEDSVLLPIVMKKCAERGFVPKTEEEKQSMIKLAQDIRVKLQAGELAPVPASALTDKGELTKEASEQLAKDPLAFAETMEVTFDDVEAHIKEAAAVATWDALETVAAAKAKVTV